MELWRSWWRASVKAFNESQDVSLRSSTVRRSQTELGYKNNWSTWIPQNRSTRREMTKLWRGRYHRCSCVDHIKTDSESARLVKAS